MWTKPPAGAGIFHPVEPDAASAPTMGMHGVVVPRPTTFADTDRTSRRPGGLGGRALGLWDRGEERGPPGTPRREGDADGVAEPCCTRPGRRSNHPGAGSNGLANPGRCGRFVRRSERDRHAPGGRPGVRRSVGADVLIGGSAPVTIKTTRRPTSTA